MSDSEKFKHSRVAKPGEPSKRCRGPLHKDGVYLTIDSFYGNRRRSDGLASRCKDCEREWARRNPESQRERSKRWREKKYGKDVEAVKPGYGARLKEFAESGEYTLPNEDEAAERLARYENGEGYRK